MEPNEHIVDTPVQLLLFFFLERSQQRCKRNNGKQSIMIHHSSSIHIRGVPARSLIYRKPTLEMQKSKDSHLDWSESYLDVWST